ncbi:hypothetical protein [Prosthecobacter fusiformis]|nr:hypothetical protein [Prosthecobacter fusiformis]
MEKSLCLQSGDFRPQVSLLPSSTPHPSSAPGTPLWLWPHVLSLEAPLVAMLWLAALAHVNDLKLMPGVLPGLGLAVWLIYLADRLLDTCGVPVQFLSIRHRFYRRFRWPILLLVMPLAAAALVWLALWVVPVGLLAHSLAQVVPIGIYLILYSVTGTRVRGWLIQAGMLLLVVLVNMLPISLEVKLAVSLLITGGTVLMLGLRWHEQVTKFFRKEVAAGLLFAFGCTTWTRFHTLGNDGPEIWAELILLGVLFVSNLALITAREAADTPSNGASGTVRGGMLIGLASLIAIYLEYLPTTLLPLTFALLAGLIALEILWQKRHSLSAEAFRVWADALTAMPAFALLLIPDSTSTAPAACCL